MGGRGWAVCSLITSTYKAAVEGKLRVYKSSNKRLVQWAVERETLRKIIWLNGMGKKAVDGRSERGISQLYDGS